MEVALRIDRIETEQHADVLVLHLEGAAYDAWKGLSSADQADAAKIKATLRSVFGLERITAWAMAVAPTILVPGEHMDVVFEEIRRFVNIAAAGTNPLDRVAACIFTTRLPQHVRDQVLMQNGKDMDPSSVVMNAKRLMSANSHAVTCVASTSGNADRVPNDANAPKFKQVRCTACYRRGHLADKCEVECFRCKQRGHIARNCSADKTKSAVSGNLVLGQLLE